ncbi:hypothetical protein Mahau_2528 [Mahella australiensis 50-1 BON]|uniref:Uncharacterized protein n=1 Tax=Mahella australiensis (strain DSM 15567 / CIP 107919 / 50-1 BON) TaxID=697281 RepID=F3ZXH2_MAHA5|nr:hypothetical protein Mahau_2496 [Mahella australiensis 50-1 BON]AEE97678.1 hypothetical protein Mahau_2528 [Mahella australiensis 50-1 BON]
MKLARFKHNSHLSQKNYARTKRLMRKATRRAYKEATTNIRRPIELEGRSNSGYWVKTNSHGVMYDC